MDESALARLRWHLTHPLRLLEHLVLRTESHASCAGLAFFALLGFYPFCLLLVWVTGDVFQWRAGEIVIHDSLREYYPEGQAFLVRNLQATVDTYGHELTLAAAFWIVLGAAGVFIPLETALNALWGVRDHRPYWRNQAVGFVLTTGGVVLGFLFVFVTAVLKTLVGDLGLGPLGEAAANRATLRLTALGFSVAAIFLVYRFLPNQRVPSRAVLPAAIAAGLVAEVVRGVYLMLLPLLELPKSQGPYYISISFALLAYFEAFVLLGGAYAAARPIPVAVLSAPPATADEEEPEAPA